MLWHIPKTEKLSTLYLSRQTLFEPKTDLRESPTHFTKASSQILSKINDIAIIMDSHNGGIAAEQRNSARSDKNNKNGEEKKREQYQQQQTKMAKMERKQTAVILKKKRAAVKKQEKPHGRQESVQKDGKAKEGRTKLEKVVHVGVVLLRVGSFVMDVIELVNYV